MANVLHVDILKEIVMNQYPIKIELLDENCKPYKEHTTDGGWDLRSKNETFTFDCHSDLHADSCRLR